jgi:NAD(P)-dependent dehydrogenase (short-subunit alcohol dehydrogenase family)
MNTVFILGLTSDISRELAARFDRDGWRVVGTHRAGANLEGMPDRYQLLEGDLSSKESIEGLIANCRRKNLEWDIFVGGAGTEEPIGSFWDCEADAWEMGITINALAPLRVLRALWPQRNNKGRSAVAFFSGSGTNSAAPAYSAYCASKIFLIKMCELLDAESSDTSFFILGPGIVRTKIHEQTLRAPEKSGPNYEKVVDFLHSDNPGTSHDEIYACLRWCARAGKETIGGRNLSIVYDAWRNGGEPLIQAFRSTPDLYKLRRFGNDLRMPQGQP